MLSERFELSILSELVPKTSVYTVPPRQHIVGYPADFHRLILQRSTNGLAGDSIPSLKVPAGFEPALTWFKAKGGYQFRYGTAIRLAGGSLTPSSESTPLSRIIAKEDGTFSPNGYRLVPRAHQESERWDSNPRASRPKRDEIILTPLLSVTTIAPTGFEPSLSRRGECASITPWSTEAVV